MVNVTEQEIRRIEQQIKDLAKTALMEDGTVWRATYTEEDAEGLALLKGWMEDGGFTVRADAAGNLLGRIEGASDRVILTGSHRDTVRNGGDYDGALGVITALNAAAALYEEFGQPQRTVEVIATAEEEGSRFISSYAGSHFITGTLTQELLDERSEEGISLREAIAAAGYEGTEGGPKTKRWDIDRFLELHIEQGAFLEQLGKQVGIVENIVGLWSGELQFHGQQNHAGTTLMSIRKDPVPSAAKLICEMTDWADGKNDQVVITFGEIGVQPGKYNVIPDTVRLSYDLRSGSKALLEEGLQKMQAFMADLPDGITGEVVIGGLDVPAAMDKGGVGQLKRIAQERGLAYQHMNSGAGHDAQVFALQYKTNMIFVPSRDGVSHSTLEYTAMEDIAAGYGLLKEYLYELAWEGREDEE